VQAFERGAKTSEKWRARPLWHLDCACPKRSATFSFSKTSTRAAAKRWPRATRS
jgi:hypothetical protein